jgi:3-deoxy-7-phosphoheptulonate synthase
MSVAARTREVRIGRLTIGAERPVVIAGPCSIDPSYPAVARALADLGVDGLRAGVFKGRTHPDSFQGLGARALSMLLEARFYTGLPLVSEVLSAADAELLAEHVDAFQVGARNMQNVRLLEALGTMSKPVILKRGLAATVDEWVAASEYIRRGGNDDVILCERGIRTFETRTRNTMDLAGMILARELSGLPVLADPSHATGRRHLVPPLARASLAAGADGLLVEVHERPDDALSDADQTIGIPECAALVSDARRFRS